MNISRLVMVALICLFSLPGLAKNARNSAKITSWTLVSDDSRQMDKIAEKFEIVARKGNRYEVYVLETALREFKQLAPTAALNSRDTDGEVQNLARDHSDFLAGYRSFEEVNRVLVSLAEQHPDFLKLEVVGHSTKGLVQYGLKVSDNVSVDENEPELMITAATHGDEIITTEVLLRFIEELVAGYGHDQRITTLIENHEIYFVPVVNPDGFSTKSRYADGVDPNRDYPWPDDPEKISTKCIANIMEFFKGHNFAGSIDFHAYGKLVMYPWAYTRDAPDQSDALIFDNLGRSMAEQNSYTYGQISRVIYVAKGSSADYYYWKSKALAYGIELADSKAPASSEIPDVLLQMREMTFRFIEHF